jgi:hypothetical protein
MLFQLPRHHWCSGCHQRLAIPDNIFGQVVIAQAFSGECHEHLEVLGIFNSRHAARSASAP